jgi:hypothetical protein
VSELSPNPEVISFTTRMAAVHPELERPVTWGAFCSIAQRCKIAVRILNMSHPARLVRLGNNVGIQIKRGLDRTLQTRYGMHEMWHFWNDDIRESCIYADDETVRHPREDAADLFAWYVTSPARIFLEPRRPMDLRKAVDLVPDLSPLELKGEGKFTIGAVGESFYQSALEAITGGHTEQGWSKPVRASLVCENTNPYDAKAVRVEILGQKVGYLARDRARLYRRRFGQRTVVCDALIVGGWDRGDSVGDFGVRLDLKLHGESHGH